MPVYKLERRIKAHPELVWDIISDVAGLAKVAPHISKVEILEGEGEGVGLKRRVYDRRGDSWIEECIAWEDGKSYTMRVDTSHYPFTFSSMEFTWSVEAGERNTTIIRTRYEYQYRYGLLGRIRDRFRFRKRFRETCTELMDNWVRRIHAREWIYEVTVENILKHKGFDIISVRPETTVIETANLLRKNRIGSVLALTEDGEIAGVVSERDIVTGLSEVGPEILDEPVTEIMTSNVLVCHPDDNMEQILACMTDRRVRHLPVVDHGKLVGIISIGDVVKTRIQELEVESDALKSFISGREWLERYKRFGPTARPEES
ncbi:MAG: CBS domain-containing protein [Xanthomonadales bacterium]|nr:CBS domain-containing protein [Xanthomonadales bacterium]